MRPEELAKELGVSGKTLRGWLRKRFPRSAAEKSKWWTLTPAQATAARQQFATPWRRATSRERMKVTTVALPERVHQRLTAAAAEQRTVMTELVRQAVMEWLEKPPAAPEAAAARPSPMHVLSPAPMLAYAQAYLRAAELLLQADPLDGVSFYPVVPHLLGHSIEVALKAFLCARGVAKKELRSSKRLGHDLIKVLERAQSLGLEEHVQVEAEERTAVEELNDLYCTRELVYSSATPGQPVLKPGQSIRFLLALATKLQDGLRGVCRPARQVGSTPPERTP